MMFNRNTLSISGGILVVTFLALFIVFGLRSIMPRDSVLRAKVSPRVINLSDSLYFYDSTDFARSYKWTFSDGTFDTTQNGYHRYTLPGNYMVTLTVNNQFKDSFFVRVKSSGYTYTAQDSIFNIEATPAALQGEEVEFRVNGYGPSEFTWDFGDKSSEITTTLSRVQHTYNVPGTYQVSLYSRNNKEPYKHNIIISSKYESVDTGMVMPLGGGSSAAENDYKMHLQKIIDGDDFDHHYNYLLKKYMCNNPQATMKINDQQLTQFYTYCQGLRFNRNLSIQSVQLSYGEKNRCVVTAMVAQSGK